MFVYNYNYVVLYKKLCRLYKMDEVIVKIFNNLNGISNDLVIEMNGY